MNVTVSKSGRSKKVLPRMGTALLQKTQMHVSGKRKSQITADAGRYSSLHDRGQSTAFNNIPLRNSTAISQLGHLRESSAQSVSKSLLGGITDPRNYQRSRSHALSDWGSSSLGAATHTHSLGTFPEGPEELRMQLRHGLQAQEEDILYLKKRILFPGIFEQESSDEERRPRRRIRHICKEAEKEKNFVPAEPEKVVDICGDVVATLSSVASLAGQLPPTSTNAQGDSSNCIAAASPYEKRKKRPQDESICADSEPQSNKVVVEHAQRVEWKHFVDEDFVERRTIQLSSDMSLSEKLCMLEEEFHKPQTLRERYVGHHGLPGYLKCQNKSIGFQDCLPPGAIVRNAIDTQKLWGIPENVPLSQEVFTELMEKMEGHHNNDYICLVFSLPFSSPEFSPYQFKIVKYANVGNRIHYTMSKYGALYVYNGMAEYTSMLQFHVQMQIYNRIRSFHFFAKFRMWKAFMLWHLKARMDRRSAIKRKVMENHFITKRPLRIMLLELGKMCEKISKISLINTNQIKALGLQDFLNTQAKHVEVVAGKLRQFESMLSEMTGAACRATIMEEGFTPDKYPEEMEFYMRQLEVPVHNLGKALDVILDYPGQWLSYSEQRKKRDICKRLADFLRLVDYQVQKAYHKILKTSMFRFLLELHGRHEGSPELPNFPEEDHFLNLKEQVDLFFGTPILSESPAPLFEVEVVWNEEELLLYPSMADYVKGFRRMFGNWREVMLSYKNILASPTFNPYTQPVVNGYVERRTCGNGPNIEMLFDLDKELEELARLSERVVRHQFQYGLNYIFSFNSIRSFCYETENLELETFSKENVFRAWEAQLHENKAIMDETEDFKCMGAFRLNLTSFRANANPIIQKGVDFLTELHANDENIEEVGEEDDEESELNEAEGQGAEDEEEEEDTTEEDEEEEELDDDTNDTKSDLVNDDDDTEDDDDQDEKQMQEEERRGKDNPEELQGEEEALKQSSTDPDRVADLV